MFQRSLLTFEYAEDEQNSRHPLDCNGPLSELFGFLIIYYGSKKMINSFD